MNLVEEFNMDDSLGLSGFVVITDNKTGKILLKKHNMILAGAKKVLLSKLLCKCSSDLNSATEGVVQELVDSADLVYSYNDNNTKKYAYKDYYLAYCKFYNDESDVIYTEDVNHKSDKSEFILEFSLDNINTSTITSNDSINCTGVLTTALEFVDNHYRLKFSINLASNQEDPIKFTSLSLVMDHLKNTIGEDHNFNLEIPFSRIKFDPIILTQESSLNLTYYVYF